MKKLLASICAMLFLGAFLFPAIDPGNLTVKGVAANGWYSFDYPDGAKAVILLVDYTKGSETQLNIDVGFSFSPWTSKTALLSERGSDNTLGNWTVVMGATAVRLIYVETVQQKGTVFFHVYPTGTLTGTVNLGIEAKF